MAGLRDPIVAAVRAAVLAPETELRRWFSWQWYWADSLADDLIGQGRLRRIDGHVTGSMCCGITGGAADDPGRAENREEMLREPHVRPMLLGGRSLVRLCLCRAGRLCS